MAVNWRSWIAAGLLAGILMMGSGVILAHGVLGPSYMASFRTHMPVPPGGMTIAKNIGVRFLLGFTAVFVVVGFQQRFGRGPKAALYAGTAVWAAANVPMALTLGQFGILIGWKLWVSLIWNLAEAWLACLVGGWAYRDRARTGAPRAT